MTLEVDWPAPWRPYSNKELGIINGVIPADKDHNLEIASYGSGLNERLAQKLNKDPSKFTNEDSHAWYLFENTETQQNVYIRVVSNFNENTPKVSITSIIFPTILNRAIKAGNFKSFPLAEIESCLSNIFFSNFISKRRLLYLAPYCTLPIDYLKPLPRDSEHNEFFYALAAEQFETIKQKYNSDNPVKIQSKINKVSESTIRNWLSIARKLGLLTPTSKGRKRVR